MRLTIDPGQTAGPISPLWFGHNLEHTRSCMWRGLSAQLIRNRKFAGMPQQHSGVALDWYRIGPPTAWHLVELPPHQWDPGNIGETYTRHFEQSDAARLARRARSRLRPAAHPNVCTGCSGRHWPGWHLPARRSGL